MDIMFENTRDKNERATASEAILRGLAPGGGLYVPTSVPRLEIPLGELAGMDYGELAFQVMRLFLCDFEEGELRGCIRAAYDEKFDTPEIAPLAKVGGAHFLELFHGPTIAFKDMALSILPHLMTVSAKKNGAKGDIVILTATSGDTGKAALAGFAGVPGTKIVVFYPKDGVSPIQERQMVTQRGENVLVVGIRGNFDQAQTGVKQIFSDQAMAEMAAAAGFRFSSANSINVGRLVPQIAYYVYACAGLFKRGEIGEGQPVNVVVPTGNFGNILAAYYAKRMGMPIGKLICASNENKVLFDFFSSGVYDKNRPFVQTSSPSMDILISSNLERLIYHVAGNDAEKNAALMKSLSETGRYEVSKEMREGLSDFYGNYASEGEVEETIRAYYEGHGYIMDTHTAVAAAVYGKYVGETGDSAPAVIASTASPYKFTRSVMHAIDAARYDGMSDFELADAMHDLSGVPVPRAIEEIRSAPVLHDAVCEPREMPAVVERFLRL